LLDVLGNDENDPQVVAAKKAIPESQVVNRILQKMHPKGYWENAGSPYLPKYKSSYWQIMALGQLGIDRTDERVQKACEHIFQFQLAEGGFSTYEHAFEKKKNSASFNQTSASLAFEHQLSCLTGNTATALIRIGYADDPRVKKALEWLVKIQNKDGGWLCPYWKAHIKDKHGCFYGTICPIEAFSELRKKNMTEEMKQTTGKGAEFLLMHHLFKADHHGYRVINQAWLKLGFPWFYGYNILRGLDVLTKLGYVNDERLNDAVEILLQKRQADGTWILENAPIGRMQTNIEGKGKPSKWITMIALRVLKRLGSQTFQRQK
jgi:prenyltransferase beta subunit